MKSRVRYRQFGVLLATPVVDWKIYEEISEDRHSINSISGRDIVKILIKNGYTTVNQGSGLMQYKFKA